MSTIIMPVSDLRRTVSRTIKELQHQDNAIYITQHGRPQAVLVSYDHYEQLLEQTRDHTDAITRQEAIQNDPEMIALADWISNTPPNPAAIHPATASLSDLLQDSPEDPDFDLTSWTEQWDALETEMKEIDQADDIAEGRGE
ncbi:MAG: type II toxin-antitoxin system Phd/YefM family antitoxin [Chloroflexota bacterium]